MGYERPLTVCEPHGIAGACGACFDDAMEAHYDAVEAGVRALRNQAGEAGLDRGDGSCDTSSG